MPADDRALIGTWKLKSVVREDAGAGERYDQLGAHPDGYLSYSSDGRMYGIIVAGERIKPDAAAPSDAERAALHKSMIAYAGTYTVEGNKVVHHIVTAWAPQRNGDDQVRYFEITGKNLIIKTAPLKDVTTGRPAVPTLVFERVE